MKKIYTIFTKFPNYIRRFGPWKGLCLCCSIERKTVSKSDKIRAFSVPTLPHPVWLREQISDHAIFWQCIVREQYDASVFPQYERLENFYRQSLAAGKQPLIIDCGGNIGLASIWLTNRFPEAQLIVIEPDSDNFAVLQRNIAPYKDRVTAFQGGIWNTSSYLRITNPKSGSAAFQVAPTDRPSDDTFKAYTISEILEQANVDAPFIVKIDIEGAQKALFQSNTDWVPKTRLIMLELDDWLLPWQGTSRPFFSCLSQYPFDYLIRGEEIFCFRDFNAI